MNYRLLNQDQKFGIRRQKLLELEAEHYRLDLELRIAASSAIENDNVKVAREQLDILNQQIETLVAWLAPTPDVELAARESLSPNNPNGSDALIGL